MLKNGRLVKLQAKHRKRISSILKKLSTENLFKAIRLEGRLGLHFGSRQSSPGETFQERTLSEIALERSSLRPTLLKAAFMESWFCRKREREMESPRRKRKGERILKKERFSKFLVHFEWPNGGQIISRYLRGSARAARFHQNRHSNRPNKEALQRSFLERLDGFQEAKKASRERNSFCNAFAEKRPI